MPTSNEKQKKSHAKALYGVAKLLEFESGWVIEYKYSHPESGVLTKHREKFQRMRAKIGDDRKARAAAKIRCSEINKDLESGWTPYGYKIEKLEEPEGHKLFDLMDIYYKIKERELRPDSRRSILSYNRLFKEWLINTKRENITIEKFKIEIAQEYLDYILINKGVSNCTYNNYVANMRAMFNFFINERKFDVKNPFEKLKKKHREPKKRKVIPRSWDNKVVTYCRENDPILELVCELIYHSYMRLSEICRCKIRHVSLKNKVIKLPADCTKKHNTRNCYLSERAIQIMIEHEIGDKEIDHNLIGKEIGNRGKLLFGEGREIKTPELDRNWSMLRDELNMPAEFQLYSWRDTGVTDLAQLGLSDDDIIKITGHLDKEMVDIYREPGVDLQVTRLLAQVGQSIGHRKNPIDERERLLKILTNE